MSKQMVDIDELAIAVMHGLQEYVRLATDGVKKAVKKTATATKNEIATTAPKRTGAYRKSWTASQQEVRSNALHITVHSKDRSQIAHLLEKGHIMRNGKRSKNYEHIHPAEQHSIEMLERDIRKALQ